MTMRQSCLVILLSGLLFRGSFLEAAAARPRLPENLALKARADATSEHNDRYLAKFAIDGKIPAAGSGAADLGAAWCVLKAKSGDRAEFTLQWQEPVEVAEIVYFGRTAWFMEECWKDYEIHVEAVAPPTVSGAPATQPSPKGKEAAVVAKGSLKMVHGPQRICFPKTSLTKITIKFLNSHGGLNPGAAEIMVFGQGPTDKELAAITREGTRKAGAAQGGAGYIPPIDEVDRGKLRELIVELMRLHGGKYARGPEHLARLEKLHDDDEQLAELQRDVLLFDVDKLVVIQRYEIEASHVYTYHYEGQRDGGGLYVVSSRDRNAKPLELVASPNGQILDCDLSYDGKTVLFSWRRGMGQGYHLWKVNVDGTGLKQLTEGEWHDYNPCWLPDGGIAFLSTRNPQFAYCWHAPVGILHRMDPDGGNLVKLSANYLNDFTPYPLEDGRIIYSRWEYVDRPAIPIQSLWTINPDGTGLAGYFGNRVLSPGTFMECRTIPGTTKIICTMTGHNGPTRGAIGIVDRGKGVNAQQAIENLTPDTPIPNVDQGCGNTDGSKPYSCPLPLDKFRFLVSARGPILARTMAGDCQATALPGVPGGMQWFNAQPVRPRYRPPAIAGKLPLGELASAASVSQLSSVGQAAKASQDSYATLFLQDVHNGLEPYVQRGQVKTIRVVRELHKPLRIDPGLRAFGFQFPVISCGATYAGKEVLGEVPVEADGSACFRVPAGIPIYFMALDAEGRAVQRMRSFTHLMPGEVQGCVGCHEHRLHTSRPRLGTAYYNREPRDLTPPEWLADLTVSSPGSSQVLQASEPQGFRLPGFDYSRIVQPILDKHCVKCHDSIDPPQHLDLSGGKTDFFNVSYDCLARENQGGRGSPYVSWIPTYNGQEWNILQVTPKQWGSPASKLAEVVFSGHPDKEGKPRVALDERERRRIFAWIDLNVPYYGTSETAYPNNPGCRQILPKELDRVLADVAKRRCAECHQGGKIPRREWIRITEAQFNPFLVAPLAKTAGGSQKCGKAVFADKSDPDYQAILALFKPIDEMLSKTPRMDMPGARPATNVSRCCQ